MTSNRAAFFLTKAAPLPGKRNRRQADSGGDEVATGNASSKQYCETLWPVVSQARDNSMKMRAAPSRASDGRSSTVKIRMSSATEDFSHSRKNLFPEFVAHRIDVMAQDDAVVGVAVGQLKLIIEL